jgi:hypothetical protein
MKYIISYCSGGLGNRILPLSSCFELSTILNRTLGIVWNKTDSCFASFNSSFKNNILQIQLKDLKPEDVSIYSNESYIIGDNELNKDSSLFNLFNKVGAKDLSRLNEIYQDDKKYIIIYDNHFFLNLEKSSLLLNFLEPIDSIMNEVDMFSKKNNISSEILGIHARGTDFIEENLKGYIKIINDYLAFDSMIKILFCSDNGKWETKIHSKFPNNVIIRKKNSYIKRKNIFLNWVNNIHRSETSVIEGLIDIHLLSITKFTVYNKKSTFAQLVNHLKNKNN